MSLPSCLSLTGVRGEGPSGGAGHNDLYLDNFVLFRLAGKGFVQTQIKWQLKQTTFINKAAFPLRALFLKILSTTEPFSQAKYGHDEPATHCGELNLGHTV